MNAVAKPPAYTLSREIDACGLKCPEPVMLLHNALIEVAAGDLVFMQATDPTTVRDVRNFCSYLGHTLIEHKVENKADNKQESSPKSMPKSIKEQQKFTYIIRKKTPTP
ncbi:MAG: sulfurtransferase TusA family protein [Gammaproteobacteria bacterium]|nr:sulfurtransferase TusA family protein [Gammaproteobacteria bacterium]